MNLASERSPTKPGSYCISFSNIRTFMPIYSEWDGEEWDISQFYRDHGGTMYWYGEDVLDSAENTLTSI